MAFTKTALLSLAASPATAFFLMPCWPLTVQRLDPIVDPAQVAKHVHQIAGGNAFAPVMDYNTTQTSDCTSCMVKGDNSVYWIPNLAEKKADGSFQTVNMHGSASMYYLNEKTRLGAGETMESFPIGLRMLAGDSEKRSGSQAFEDQAVNYKCLNYKGTPTDHKGFPQENCPDGVRAEITFPSCWDGENLDSDDHKSHMAYPTTTFEAGACPKSHPHHLVVLKTEWIFETNNHQWSGEQPFVWSSGDPTGFGFHADFIMGWDADLLAAAVEGCDNTSGKLSDCSPFAGRIPETQQYLDPGTCRIDSYVDEVAQGTLEKLPGCNPIQDGPGRASNVACDDTVALKGDWSDFAGKIGGAVHSAASAISSAVNGAGSNFGTAATGSSAPAISAAPAQFYQKEASPAEAAPVDSGNGGKTVTDWEFVTETTTLTGAAPGATAGRWNDQAWKRDAAEHMNKHRHAHGRRRAA